MICPDLQFRSSLPPVSATSLSQVSILLHSFSSSIFSSPTPPLCKVEQNLGRKSPPASVPVTSDPRRADMHWRDEFWERWMEQLSAHSHSHKKEVASASPVDMQGFHLLIKCRNAMTSLLSLLHLEKSN